MRYLTLLLLFSELCFAGTVNNWNQWQRGYGLNPKGVPSYETHKVSMFLVQPTEAVMQTRAYSDLYSKEDHTGYPNINVADYRQTNVSVEQYFTQVTNDVAGGSPQGYMTYDDRTAGINKRVNVTVQDVSPTAAAIPDLYSAFTINMTAGLIYRDRFDCGTAFEHPRYDAAGNEQFNGPDLVTETNGDWCFFLYIAPVTYPDGSRIGPMVGKVHAADADALKYIRTGLAPWIPLRGTPRTILTGGGREDIVYLDGRYHVRSPDGKITLPHNGLNMMHNRYEAVRMIFQDKWHQVKTKSKGSLALVIGAIVGILVGIFTGGVGFALMAGAAAGGIAALVLDEGPTREEGGAVGTGTKSVWGNQGPWQTPYLFMPDPGGTPKRYHWAGGIPNAALETQMLNAGAGWVPNADYTPPSGDIRALAATTITPARRYQFEQKAAYNPIATTPTAWEAPGAVPKAVTDPDVAAVYAKYKPLMDATKTYCEGTCGPCDEAGVPAMQAKMEGTDGPIVLGARTFPAGACYRELGTLYDTHKTLYNDFMTDMEDPTGNNPVFLLLRTPEGAAFNTELAVTNDAVNAAAPTLADRWFVGPDENATIQAQVTPVFTTCKATFDAPPLPPAVLLSTKETEFHTCLKNGAGDVMMTYAAMEARSAIAEPFKVYTAMHPSGQLALGKLSLLEDYTGQPSPKVYDTYLNPANRCVPETPIASFASCIAPKILTARGVNLNCRYSEDDNPARDNGGACP